MRSPNDPSGAFSYLDSLQNRGIRPGLFRIKKILARLGNPERRFQAVHVVGTNGKGSVCAMTESIVRAAGKKTGFYSSPDLFSPTERIKINGKDISRASMARRIWALRKTAERAGLALTHFEFLTALAIDFFAEQKVEVGVIEAGLGGRLDATNVFDDAVVVLTPMGLDHEDWLGKGLASIAAEKVAVIKTNARVIGAKQSLEARLLVRGRCRSQRARASFFGRDFWVERVFSDASGTRFDWIGKNRSILRLHVGLHGLHQAENAALAVMAAQAVLGEDVPLAQKTVRQGLSRARWPLRFSILSKKPLVIADVAHNPHGARALARALGDVVPNRRFVGVFGCSNDKDFPNMLKPLFLRLAAIVFLESPFHGTPALELEHWVAREGVRLPSFAAPDPKTALDWALQIRRDDEGVLIFGSHYFFGRMGIAKRYPKTFK